MVMRASLRVMAAPHTGELADSGSATINVPRVSLKLLSLRDRLKIDVPGFDDLEAVGDLFHHEYNIHRRGRSVAQVSKRWLTLTDSYGIEIDEDEDQILLLASAVVIDEILDLRKRADKE